MNIDLFQVFQRTLSDIHKKLTLNLEMILQEYSKFSDFHIDKRFCCDFDCHMTDIKCGWRDACMNAVVDFLKLSSDLLWGGPMSGFVFAFSVWATVYFRFPQKKLSYALRESVRKSNTSGFSTLSCLAMNLAATLGVGNIVGVAIAIELGGPGAVFWCCITGFFAMAVSYGECFLSIQHKNPSKQVNGTGGPMVVMDQTLGKPFLAKIYAGVAALTGLSMGAMVSANSVSSALETVSVSPLLSGLVLSILTAAVVIGGVKSIADFCTRIVPVMVFVFIGGCISVLWLTRSFAWKAICLILSDAFDLQSLFGAMIGGGVSKAIRFGISRGLFSNEAGMGSSAITASALPKEQPVRSALICSTATFWDTCVLCALTGAAFISAQLAYPELFSATHGFSYALAAFSIIPGIGKTALTLTLLLLGFTSIVGWCYIGAQAYSYLFGTDKSDRYRISWIGCVFLGSVLPIDAVWYASDLFTAAMMLPNLWTVYCLRNECRDKLETFCDQNKRIPKIHRIFTHENTKSVKMTAKE